MFAKNADLTRAASFGPAAPHAADARSFTASIEARRLVSRMLTIVYQKQRNDRARRRHPRTTSVMGQSGMPRFFANASVSGCCPSSIWITCSN